MYTSVHIIPSDDNIPEIAVGSGIWPLRLSFTNEPSITLSLTIPQGRTLLAELTNALGTLADAADAPA